MKNILLPFQDDDVAEAAFVSAHMVANQLKGHIEGLFVLPQPQIIAGEGIALPGVYLTQMAEDGKKLALAAKNRFESALSQFDFHPTENLYKTPNCSATWHEIEGLESQIIGERGRIFDLIVIARTTKYYAGDWNIICEAALFESGRPVLIASDKNKSNFWRKVIIAWNSSTESARTVAAGMPFLLAAEEVVILETPAAAVPGPSGKELAQCLRHHGIDANVEIIDKVSGDKAGAEILEYAARSGADLILKCAYTHTRLRQLVFGGVTRYILAHSPIPVLMAH